MYNITLDNDKRLAHIRPLKSNESRSHYIQGPFGSNREMIKWVNRLIAGHNDAVVRDLPKFEAPVRENSREFGSNDGMGNW